MELLIAAVAVAALAFAFFDRRQMEAARFQERREWESERQVLLSRIANPSYVPPPSGEDYQQMPDEVDDDYDIIGTIQNGAEPEDA